MKGARNVGADKWYEGRMLLGRVMGACQSAHICLDKKKNHKIDFLFLFEAFITALEVFMTFDCRLNS